MYTQGIYSNDESSVGIRSHIVVVRTFSILIFNPYIFVCRIYNRGFRLYYVMIVYNIILLLLLCDSMAAVLYSYSLMNCASVRICRLINENV